jgi:hypothetical protein
MKAFISFILFVVSFCFTAEAQRPLAENDNAQLLKLQDSLVSLGFDRVNKADEPERYNANYAFIRTLVNALKIPNSFSFGFDSLKTISIQPSPDGNFRIFSWYVLNNDGTYRYYGTIQMKTADGKLQMFPLTDYTSAIKSPADTVTTNEKWYGAQYYKIIPVTRNVRTPYYVLLGWKGNNLKSTKKVIEILSFKDGKAWFGMPVFDGDKERPNKQRIIFEYSKQVSMLLNYTPDKSTIIFDHLSPPDARLKGNFDSYGPDMSYDGFRFVNGRWRLVEDLELKNPPSESDQQFNDPKNPPKFTPKL